MVVNNVPIKRPVIDYTLPSGTVIQLYGDPRHDRKTADADGLVDLIIDESNYENYFIDFEINRLSGNLETDYYNKSQQSVETPVVNQDSTSQSAVQPIQSTEQPIQSTEQSMQSTEQPIQSTSEEPVENIETIV